jgi:hypothetical protein
MPPQTTPAVVSGSPIEPALGSPTQEEDYQSPIAPLRPPAPTTPPLQHNVSPMMNQTPALSEVSQQPQPVAVQPQRSFAPHLQTPEEIQIEIQKLRLEIITHTIDRAPSLKEYFRVSVNNGQITIRESSGLRLTGEDYQRLHQTLRNALNNTLPGIGWTLDKQWIRDENGQNVSVNRMNLFFLEQNPAVQPQSQPFSPAFFAQPIQPHYPAVQQQHQIAQPQYGVAQPQYQGAQPQYQAAQPQYPRTQPQYSAAPQYQAAQYYLAGSSFHQPAQQQSQQGFAQPQQGFAQPQQHATQNGNPYRSPSNRM